GIGELPALVALFIYGLLPVVRNTYVGITGVDPAVVEAATGMGVTDRQLLWLIELPLAMPVIVAGLRTMTVMTIGTATIAAMIGAGGLGVLIFRGISTVNNAMIIAGAVPVALLAVLVDWILGLVERRLMSRPAFRGQKESDRMRVKGQVHGV
ncbi:MAG: ABC transporter permease, partial [Bacillota bacterium]